MLTGIGFYAGRIVIYGVSQAIELKKKVFEQYPFVHTAYNTDMTEWIQNNNKK